MRRTGILLCLASAVAFGTMGIFGKLAYGDGATVGTLLAVRFALAAVLFWCLVAATGARRPGARAAAPRRRARFGLGALGYSAQAGCFFVALDRVDASLLSLLVYTYPALVTVAAIMLGRERADRRIGDRPRAGLDRPRAGARRGRAGHARPARRRPRPGRRARLHGLHPQLRGDLPPRRADRAERIRLHRRRGVADGRRAAGRRPASRRRDGAGLGWLAAIAVISTVAAIGLFFAGLRRVGSTTASIVSTAEPLTTVLLASVVLGESLDAVQLLGGALVLAGVVVLSVARPAAAGPPPTADPEGAVADALTGRVALVAGRDARRGTGDRRRARARPARSSTPPDAARGRPGRSTTGRRRSRRPAELMRAAGGRGEALRVDHLEPEQVAGLVARIDARARPAGRAGQRHLGRGEPGRLGDAGLGARPRQRAAAAAAGDRDAPDHQPPRAAAADPPAGRAGDRGDGRHGASTTRPTTGCRSSTTSPRPRSSGWRGARATSSHRTAAPRSR